MAHVTIAALHVTLDNPPGFPWATLIAAIAGALAGLVGAYVGHVLTKSRDQESARLERERRDTDDLRRRVESLRLLTLGIGMSFGACDAALAGHSLSPHVVDPLFLRQATIGTSLPDGEVTAATDAAVEVNHAAGRGLGSVTPELRTAIDRYRQAAEKLRAVAATTIEQVQDKLRDLRPTPP
jgi:hypothetical protein